MLISHFDTGSAVLEYGEGPDSGTPFVILHGGAASWSYATGLIELLTGAWHVYALDLRGHGGSSRVPGHYRVVDYADDIGLFLERHVREPAVLFGHSLGGLVAIVVAARNPALVRALIIGDAPLTPDERATESSERRSMNELWRSIAGRPEQEIEEQLREMPVREPGQMEPVRAEEAFGAQNPWFSFQARNLHCLDPDVLTTVLAGPNELLAGYSPAQLLPQIDCPVLLLQADPQAGALLTDADVDMARRLLPRSSHVMISGVGHELHSTQPARVRTEISEFLAAEPA